MLTLPCRWPGRRNSVPEENVQELMERILKLEQRDRTARIRERLRNPTGYRIDSLPETKFQAQIPSFAA